MSDKPLDGRCTCGEVQYRLETSPMIIHCCHCTWCQRETGGSYVVNALIEADQVTLQQGEPEMIDTPTASGNGQKIWRCPTCKVSVWSNYAGFGDKIRFVRAGTLEKARELAPDIHVFTSTKQSWVQIPDDHRAFEEFYSLKEEWSDESRARLRQALSE